MNKSSINTSEETLKSLNQVCPICNKRIVSTDKTIKGKNGKLVHYYCLINHISKGVESTGIGFGDT